MHVDSFIWYRFAASLANAAGFPNQQTSSGFPLEVAPLNQLSQRPLLIRRRGAAQVRGRPWDGEKSVRLRISGEVQGLRLFKQESLGEQCPSAIHGSGGPSPSRNLQVALS